MEVGILGSVEMSEGGVPVVVEAAKERAIMAVLAVNVGVPVSPMTLFQALWGEDPPATAERTLQSHVSKLRRLASERRIEADLCPVRALAAAGCRVARSVTSRIERDPILPTLC